MELARRTLPDGRTLIVYARLYNTLLTISTPFSLNLGIWDSGY